MVGERLAGRGVGVSPRSGVDIADWVEVGMGITSAGDGEVAAPPAGVGETVAGADRGSDTGVAVGSGLGGRPRGGGTVGAEVLESLDSDGMAGSGVGVEDGDAVGRGFGVEAVPHPASQNIITRAIKEMRSGTFINRFYQNRCNEAENGR